MNAYVGQIVLFAFDATPEGFTPCEGQVLPIRDQLSLFSLLRARHGGDGVTTFAIPDLRGTEPVEGMKYFIALGQAHYPARG